MTGEDKLCPACERVDLYSLFTGPRHFSDLNPVRVNARIGTLQEVKSNKHCPLCRLVKHELYGNKNTHPWPHHKGGKEYDPAKVRCFLQPRRSDYSSEVRYINDATSDLICTTLWIHLQPESESEFSEEENRGIKQYAYRWGGHIKLLSPDSVDPKRPLLNGYPTTTLDSELKLLAKWLDGCIEHHETTCQRPQLAEHLSGDISVIRAIDISTRNIIDISPATSRYATLSWVWGADRTAYSGLADKLVVTQDSIALPTEGIPSVIEDAIYVCGKLAIPYLWVDLYCVHQHDPEVRAAEIRVMGYIYHLSCITLVAARGSTLFSHRLNSDSVARHRKIETVSGRQYISTYSPIVEPSQWASRAWTYQEGQLASRIAFFDADEVTFYCSAGQWRESLHSGLHGHDIRLPGIDTRSSGKVILSATQWLESPLWSFEDYRSIIFFYNRREISYESDRLDAIRGCLNIIAERKGIEFFEGMPSMDFHYAFLFTALWGEGRRDDFPRWSWAGWSAPNASVCVQPVDHNGVHLDKHDDGSLSFAGGTAENRELEFDWKPRTSNRCSQQLACLNVSKVTSTVLVRSASAVFAVEDFADFKFQLRDKYGNILKHREGGFEAHVPRWKRCGESTKHRLRAEGIELISIVKASLVEGPSPLPGPLDHVFCLGINRAAKNSQYVERWGMFMIPREAWEKAEPKETTVEFC